MGLGAKASASRERDSQNVFQNTTGTNTTNTSQQTAGNTAQSTTGATDATFNSPQGQQILAALTGAATGGNSGQNYLDQAGSTYGKLAGDQGTVNPYVEDVIKNSNSEADKTFGNRLMQLRAGGYRGGTAANINGQGRYAADFSAQQGGTNANLRYGAFNDAQARASSNNATGAAGLGSLGNSQQGLGQALLALLRGSSNTGANNVATTGSSQGVTVEQILQALTGGSSGTKSNVTGSGGFSFGTGAG